jgi:hypothetical protein
MLLIEDRRESCDDFIHDFGGDGLQFARAASAQIEGAGLVAADDSGCSGAGSGERDGESGSAGKASPAGDRQDDRYAGDAIESLWRGNEDGTAPFLLVTFGRVKAFQPNFTALQISSRPTGLSLTHPLFFRARLARGLHCFSNWASEYRGRRSGFTTKLPLSTVRPTFAPECRSRISSKAGGTVNMTEPPTFRRFVVLSSIVVI